MWPTRLSTRRRVAVEDDLDDPLAVDAHRERLLHLRVEELPVLRLARVRVPGDVRRLGARHLVDDDVVVLLEDVDGVERHLVDPVEVALLELGDHRVGVREVRERDRLGVGRLAVVALPRDEDGRALLLVLLDRVGAGRDDRQVLLRVVGLEALAVRADERLPDVLREDEELLELGEDVADRGVVVDDERVVVGRLGVLHVGERGRGDRRRPVRVLERRVDRPGGVARRSAACRRTTFRPASGGRSSPCRRPTSPRTRPSRPRSRARRRPARTARAAGRS